jgi:hypothetical protein
MRAVGESRSPLSTNEIEINIAGRVSVSELRGTALQNNSH